MSRPMPQEMHEALWYWGMIDPTDDPKGTRALLVNTFVEPARWALAMAWHQETYGGPENGRSDPGASGRVYDWEVDGD